MTLIRPELFPLFFLEVINAIFLFFNMKIILTDQKIF